MAFCFWKAGELQADLKKLRTSRERIFDLIEDEQFDKNEMTARLNRNRGETLTVEEKIKEGWQKLTHGGPEDRGCPKHGPRQAAHG